MPVIWEPPKPDTLTSEAEAITSGKPDEFTDEANIISGVGDEPGAAPTLGRDRPGT